MMKGLFHTLLDYDTAVYRWCNQVQRFHRLMKIIRWVSRSGDGYFYVAIGMLALLFDPINGYPFTLAALLGFAIDLPIYVGLKRTFKRHRPFVTLQAAQAFIVPADKFSLPSGHTAAAFLMATLIGNYYPEFFALALCWSVMIALSRVLLGVHYPSDLLAGMLLGVAAAQLTITITAI